jgi:hypothetical protein
MDRRNNTYASYIIIHVNINAGLKKLHRGLQALYHQPSCPIYRLIRAIPTGESLNPF